MITFTMLTIQFCNCMLQFNVKLYMFSQIHNAHNLWDSCILYYTFSLFLHVLYVFLKKMLWKDLFTECMYMHHVHAGTPRGQRGQHISWDWSYRWYKTTWCLCWEPNPSPLQEKHMPLTAELLLLTIVYIS